MERLRERGGDGKACHCRRPNRRSRSSRGSPPRRSTSFAICGPRSVLAKGYRSIRTSLCAMMTAFPHIFRTKRTGNRSGTFFCDRFIFEVFPSPQSKRTALRTKAAMRRREDFADRCCRSSGGTPSQLPRRKRTGNSHQRAIVSASESQAFSGRSPFGTSRKGVKLDDGQFKWRTTKISRLARLTCHVRNRRRQLGCILLFALDRHRRAPLRR